MMKYLITSTLCAFGLLMDCSETSAQTIGELYKKRDFAELIKKEKDTASLDQQDLFIVGYAFFRKGNDQKAVALYDKDIKKGLDDGPVHFYKGLSLCFLEQYAAALPEVEKALQKDPQNQEYMNQKALIYKYQGDNDKALVYFEEATKLPNTFGEPFYWVANMYHNKEQYKKALDLYYTASQKVPERNSHLVKTWRNIGLLEYTQTKNYQKSAQAYEQAIKIAPEDYTYYPKLIKAYNGAKAFVKADSVFGLVKAAYNAKKLSEDEMKYKNIQIDEFEWKGQKLVTYKMLIDPQEATDISHKIYLLDKEKGDVTRMFLIEKTFESPDGTKYLLCEKEKSGTHHTYPYGWNTDQIRPDQLQDAVLLVLNKKIKPGASSNFGD